MKFLISGGAGFIGSNFIRYLLQHSEDQIVNFDCLTYAGNLENLAEEASNPRYRFVRGDITDVQQVAEIMEEGFDAIVNCAAESHVDRSILDSGAFVRTNVLGTQVLLEAVRRHKAGRFLQVSTDEVYGSLGETGFFREDSPLAPNSPYSASKAAADLLVRAYAQTYGLDTVITRCSNNYGPRQFPEKFIPVMILNALEDRKLPVYGDGRHRRDWIHVEDHCRALEAVLRRGRPGRVYNIGAEEERENLEVARRILQILAKPEERIEFIADRPGHDRRYAIDARLIREELEWQPSVRFEEGLRQTVRWYQTHSDWVDQVRSGAYLNYYRAMYAERDRTLSKL